MGVYSNSFEIKSIAVGSALRNTWVMVSSMNDASTCKETNFVKGMRLDLGELVLHVIGVHSSYLIASRRAEDLDDFDQLIDAGLSWE